MNADKIIEKLEAIASELQVKVTYEALLSAVGGGGMCRVKGQYRIIVDKRASVPERVALLARCLSGMDLSALDIAKPVRETLNFYSLRKAG